MATLTRSPIVTAEHVADALVMHDARIIARGRFCRHVTVVPYAEFNAMVDAIPLVDPSQLSELAARGITTPEAMAEEIMRNA